MGEDDREDEDEDGPVDDPWRRRRGRLAIDVVSDVELLYGYPTEDEILESRRGWWS